MTSAHYPIFLDLADRPCVVVGGGPIAEGKVRGLLAAGGRVTVVSPTLTPALAVLAAEGRVAHHARPYAAGDLAGATLALAASGDRAVSAAVLAEGRARGVWVNSADDPARCDFFLPAVLRRGALTVAVSTGGASPALTRAVRDELERFFPPELAGLVEVVAAVRHDLRARAMPVSAEVWSAALADELARLWPAARGAEARARLLERLEAR
jgi:precorrin-2 dehydrogenase/sirohydrochlorin ferrochelatase